MRARVCFGGVDGLGRGQVGEGVGAGNGAPMNEGRELNVLFTAAADEPLCQIVRFPIFFRKVVQEN